MDQSEIFEMANPHIGKISGDTLGHVIDISEFNIDEMEFPVPNYVIIEQLTDHENERTKSGIYIAPIVQLQKRHEHANILMRVIAPPKKLVHAKTIKEMADNTNRNYYPMPWDTDIEIEKDDVVVVKPAAVYNCPVLKHKDKKYLKIHYSDLVLAFKKANNIEYGKENKVRQFDEVNYYSDPVMLNGYILCEEVTFTRQSKWIIDPFKKIDFIHGIIRYIGKPNRFYHNSRGTNKSENHYVEDSEGLKVGDKFIKRKAGIHIIFQSEVHPVIESDARLFVTQSCDIYAIYE